MGVTRGALQQKVRSGELRAFEGSVPLDELMRAYPTAALESDPAAERVAKIKDEAFGKRLREHMLPNSEVLSQRLYEQSRELADLRVHLQRYHAIVVGLRERLHEPRLSHW